MSINGRKVTTAVLIAAATVVIAILLPDPVAPPAQAQVRATLGDVLSYFPIQPGNHWLYQRRGTAGTEMWAVKAGDRFVAPNGRAYFPLAGYFDGYHSVRAPRNVVTEFNATGIDDHLWYRLGASVGTTWVLALELPWALYPNSVAADCVSGARLTIGSRTESITIPAGTFRGVVRVDWQTRCADAGIATEYFAPGVGLIRRVEQSFTGPVVSDLVRAEIGGVVSPRLPYATEISLDGPLYVNNLMPPIGPGSIATVHGVLVVRNRTDRLVIFEFDGCRKATIVVSNEAGEPVLRAQANDGGCCDCRFVLPVELRNDLLAIPFAFRLETPEGRPLPDGKYGVAATLDTLDGAALRPAATARIEVTSVH